MRAAPAVTVILARPRSALVALGVLASATLAASMAWAVGRGDRVGLALLLLVCLYAAWLAVSVARRVPLRLQWDGQHWWLDAMAGDAPRSGTLAVALDLGAWMLLRFRADAARWPRRTRWLPAERRALPAEWHALRCAVYSPRPPPAAQDSAV